MTTTPALVLAASGVGFGHAILPDHWVPLAIVGRTRRYPLLRITRLAAAAGLAHVLVSLVLGAIVVLVGLQFRSAVQSAQDAIVGTLLIVTGLAFAALELTGRGHTHAHAHDHDHDHDHDHQHHHHSTLAVLVPFGAAASPDLTILPVFLAAATAGLGTAAGSLIAFAAVTIGTIVALTVAAAATGYQLGGRWLERWGNGITAGVLILIGLLVATGVL